MFDPPPEMHTRFEAALARGARRSRSQALIAHRGQGRRDRRLQGQAQPDRSRLVAGFVRPGERRARRAGDARRERCVPALARNAAARTNAPAAPGRPAHRGARLSHCRRGDARGRQEPHGGARRSAGDGRLLQRLLRQLREPRRIRSRAAERSAAERRVAQSQRDEAVRRVGRHQSVQLSVRARGRAGGRGARHRQHGRAQRRERNSVGRPTAGRLPARCRIAAGRLQLSDGTGRGDRRCARRASADQRRHVHRLLRNGHGHRAQARRRPLSETLHRRDGRQECLRRHRERRSRTRFRRHRAQRVRHGRTEMLGVVAPVRRRVGRGRAGSEARCSECRRSAWAIRRARRIGWVRWSANARTASTAATSIGLRQGGARMLFGGEALSTGDLARGFYARRRSPRRRSSIRCGAKKCSCRS